MFAFIRDSHRFCVLSPAINRWLSLVFLVFLCTRLVTLLAGQIRGILAEEKSDMEGPLARLGLGVAGFMGK